MANVLGELFQDIADAIRSKTGSTDKLKPNQFPEAIEGITTGGGGSSADVRYVTFRNESTGEEYKKPVAYGDDCVDVVAKGLWKTPTKASTAQYNYTFYGWGASDGGAADANILKNIRADKTVYAIFTATARLYTITFYDEDGTTVLSTQNLAYGATPSYTPTETKENYTATWSPKVSAVTGNASYTLVWVENAVTWDLTDGVLTISGYGAMEDYVTTSYGSKVETPWISNASEITSLVIGDGITRIGNNAFMNLSALVSATIPGSVTSIGEGAFRYCNNLTNIDLPAELTSLGNAVFTSCSQLASITIPSGVTAIPDYMFSQCTGLTNITFPSGITAIGKYAFLNCKSLGSVTFENTVGWWVSKSATATSGDAVDVSDPATNVTHLVTTYPSYYWKRT